LLGFGSEFPIRQLEKAGRLQARRGSMRQAWYPRAEVLALASLEALPAARLPTGRRESAEPVPRQQAGAIEPARWTDGQLIALLRAGVVAPGTASVLRPRTAVDLVADTGIGIARATRVYRFWLAHDVHPTAALARQSRSSGNSMLTAADPVTAESPPSGEASPPSRPPAGERRASSRIERDGLIRKLRDPDPAVRASAFEQLRPGRRP
jgi:hypothetical protein